MKKIIPYIPLAVIAGTLLYTGYMALTTTINLQAKHYAAIILTLANIICYAAKFKPRAGKVITLGIILLGCFNVLGFTPAIYSLFIGIGRLEISFQPYSFLLLAIFVICNLPSLSKYRQ
ncbi:hypothetical protein [Chitinophaga barathri]|nr:hypothetical protein [Chitinophaga barathri]